MSTERRKLIFFLAPLAVEPTLGRHVVSKEQRWALFLSHFHFVKENVQGNANVFADILKR